MLPFQLAWNLDRTEKLASTIDELEILHFFF